MTIITEKIEFFSKGNTSMKDVTSDVENAIKKSGMTNGSVLVFVVGSTIGITTIEFEPGLIKDIPEIFDRLIPQGKKYHHDETWGDGNGFSHLRASLVGCSVTIPFENGKMLLGTWQQIVCIDFDNRVRNRTIIVQINGE